MRLGLLLLVPALACGCASAPTAVPAGTVSTTPAPAPPAPTVVPAVTPPCERPITLAPVEVMATPGERCTPSGCEPAVRVAVRNPNAAPVHVTEAHGLFHGRQSAIMLEYAHPVLVQAGETSVMPRELPYDPRHIELVRVLFNDGWGTERVAEQPLREANANVRPSEGGAAVATCTLPPPPPLAALALHTELQPEFVQCGKGCRARATLSIENPNPTKIRVTDVWIKHPSGGSTSPARMVDALIYVDGETTGRLPHRVELEQVGTHAVRVEYVDGWGRHHELHGAIEVTLGQGAP